MCLHGAGDLSTPGEVTGERWREQEESRGRWGPEGVLVWETDFGVTSLKGIN